MAQHNQSKEPRMNGSQRLQNINAIGHDSRESMSYVGSRQNMEHMDGKAVHKGEATTGDRAKAGGFDDMEKDAPAEGTNS